MATTDQLTALAADGQFRQRIRTLMLQAASGIYSEAGTVPFHNARVAFAFKLFGSPAVADQAADVIVTRTNLAGSVVSYDFGRRAVVTDASDAAIASQIATDWNMLAGV